MAESSWWADQALVARQRRLLKKPNHWPMLETLETCRELLLDVYSEPPCDEDCECILHDLDALLGERDGGA